MNDKCDLIQSSQCELALLLIRVLKVASISDSSAVLCNYLFSGEWSGILYLMEASVIYSFLVMKTRLEPLTNMNSAMWSNLSLYKLRVSDSAAILATASFVSDICNPYSASLY